MLQEGTRASATVLSSEQLVGYVNGVPKYRLRLLVRPSGRDPFIASVSIRDFVPEDVVGEEAIVRFDPDATHRVVFESFPEYERRRLALRNTGPAQRIARQQALARELDKSPTSVRTSARVTAFERTRLKMGGGLVATLVIEAADGSGERITAGIIGLFDPSKLYKYQPGREVFIVYDPHDPTSRIALDPSRTPRKPTTVEVLGLPESSE